jgi:hypothetical protein
MEYSRNELLNYMNESSGHRFMCNLNDTMNPNSQINQSIGDFCNMSIKSKKLPFQPVKMDKIFDFNKKIKFSNDGELWYLCSPSDVMSGPVSSKFVKDAYDNKLLDGNWKIRPIDIFKFINKPNYTFSNLTIINFDLWTDLIENSDILKYATLNTNPRLDNTLDITYIKKEELSFNNHTIINELTKTKSNTNHQYFLDEVDEEGWEEVGKKKPKKQNIDESIYLAPISKRNPKPEKPKTKVDIIPPEQLVNNLRPKKKKWENQDIKTNFKIGSDYSIIKQDKQMKKH